MNNTVRIIKSYIERHHILNPHQRVLVALSGGADSICLLLTLRILGYECYAAHCNFQLRGDESERDERFVRDICANMCVQIYTRHFDTRTYAREHSVSIEMAARDLRYSFFRELLKEHNITALAVGHHQDDNIETVLLNMVRGTGIRGMSGIRPVRHEDGYDVIRPLLCLTHSDIVSFLRLRNESWVEDSTNQYDDVARNIIRLDVMPLFKRINASATKTITSTIDNLQEVYRVYKHSILHDLKTCLDERGNMSIAPLLATTSPRSVLHEWLNGRGFNATHERNILESAQECLIGRIVLSDTGERLLVDRDTIVLERNEHYFISTDITFTRLPREDVTISHDLSYAYLDADKVCGSLTIRNVRPKDEFKPFGMHGKTRLLSDFMTDRKLNLFQKQHQLVVVDSSNTIAWVVGLRSSEPFRVDDNTKEVIVCRLHNEGLQS